MRISTRVAALAATLALTGTTALVAPAQAAPEKSEDSAASWLSAQLTDGAFSNDYGAQWGPTIDLALSLQQVGGHDADVTAVKNALAAHIGDYITGEQYGDAGSTYAGATAKALTFAQSVGVTDGTLGGVDLQDRLEAQVETTAPNAGRLHDTSTFGDFANTLGQAFAVRSLTAADSTRAGDVLDFLLEQQCSAGFFRQGFSDAADADQSCDAGHGTASVDATALAVRTLSQLPQTGAVPAAVSKGQQWLTSHQNADGSWTDPDLGPNSNTTGLAAAALPHTASATKAAAWLRAHQAQPIAACRLASDAEAGTVAPTDQDATDLAAHGIGDLAARTRYVIATGQAATALADFAGPSKSLILAAPKGFIRAGSRVLLRSYNVTPGDRFCLNRGNWKKDGHSTSTDRIDTTVTAPAGTATRGYRLSDGSGRVTSVALRVLGTLSLKPRASVASVARSHVQGVSVAGLQPGERVKFNYRGRTIGSGKANAAGKFGAYFNVGRVLGKQSINVYGQFPGMRHGTTTFTVVR